MADFTSTQRQGFTKLASTARITDLQASRIAAGITCQEAAVKLSIPVEMFDNLEAGKIDLSIQEIDGYAYAYAVGVVIEPNIAEVLKLNLVKRILKDGNSN